MKIVRYHDDAGLVHSGRLLPDGLVTRMSGALFGAHAFDGPTSLPARLLAPIDPPNILAIGRNYREHAEEMKAGAPDTEPLIFLKATTSIIGPHEQIVLPKSAPDEVDFEAELGVVIGKQAKNIAEGDALSYVLGYVCANDVSARDCQKRRDKQWARGKSFDTFCPIGPALVTADEVDPARLTICSRLNGRIMQESNTDQLIFSVPYLISYLSHQFTLPPGTLILTGTPAGVGAARTPPVFLRPGDEISVEIDAIGALTNSVRGT